MRKELINELINLVEEYINEVSDELVKKTEEKRQEKYKKAIDALNSPEFHKNAQKALYSGDMNLARKLGQERKNLEADVEKNKKKVENFRNLKADRMSRNWKKRVKVEQFRKSLLDKENNSIPLFTKKAKEEHDNALINQGLRNKLEKSLKVSESCLNDIVTLIEGEVIDFQKKRKEIVLDRNAHKLANMMKSGELSGIRVNKGGELMGDPVAIKKVKDIEKENREVGLGRKVGLD